MPYKDPAAQKQAQHESYLRTKKKVDDRQAWKRRTNRQAVQDLKENSPCADCEKFYPHYVMDFDHLSHKVKEVSKLVSSASLATVMAEIAKCELVCANCHRERTHRRK